MDDIVLRAMQKWPDVPNVFGWLRLDRRGNWLVKSRSGEFGRIANFAVCEFIGRNYAADERGRWKLGDNEGNEAVAERMVRPIFCLRAGKRFDADAAILPQAEAA